MDRINELEILIKSLRYNLGELYEESSHRSAKTFVENVYGNIREKEIQLKEYVNEYKSLIDK